MITIEAHLARILEAVDRLPVEPAELAEALGRCLAAPVHAELDVPPWTNSAMDGYAIRHEDVAAAGPEAPVALRVVADVPAGSGADPEIGPGEATRIMTGAPLPSGADTVIPQEATDGGLETVRIEDPPSRGRHVRHRGEDRRHGDLILEAGRALTAEALASIAAVGVGRVEASQLPRVAAIATGDELVSPGESIDRGQIPDSNSLLIGALIRSTGAVLASAARVGDRPGQLERAVEEARNSDVIVMTGGVSVGAHDPVKELFSDEREVRFDRVSMQPGKPQAFGRLEGGPLVFGLPGNPVSAWVSFQVFVKPALRRMQGYGRVVPEPAPATAAAGWRTPSGRVQILPARIEDGERRTVAPAASGGSGSHLVASLAAANGYAIVAAETDRIEPGDRVPTVRLDDPEQLEPTTPE